MNIAEIFEVEDLWFVEPSFADLTDTRFNALLAVWLPNMIYSVIAIGLYRWASK